jgi:virulence-associated protein VapD
MMADASTRASEDLFAPLPPPPNRKTMYAIAFDLETELLQEHYPAASWQNGYRDVRRILEAEGFIWRQGSVYFGDDTVNPVKCVLTAQRLTRELPWFAAVARDVRMLRIEENNDLRPAIDPT